jgi:hypothetical protein
MRLAVAVVVLASLAAGVWLRAGRGVDESPYLGEVAPGVEFGPKGGSPPHYGSASGVVAFNSFDVAPDIRGYAGPIKMLVALEPSGRICGIRVLEHRETPNFVHRMDKPEFLGQFLGKSVNDPLRVDADIDGISRATVSVEALTESVRVSARAVASGAMGLRVTAGDGARRAGLGWLWYLALFAAAYGLYLSTRRPGRSRGLQRARDAVLVAGLLVAGLWLASPFSLLHVLNALMLRVSGDPLFLAVFLTTLGSVALAGRFYCGWLCPFGAAAEFLGRLPARKWAVSSDVEGRWRRVKYPLLALVAAVVLVSGRPGYGNIETYVTLFSLSGSFLGWTLVGVSLLANLRVRRFWCRYLCPVAALTGLLCRRDEAYGGAPDCPMGNVSTPHTSECIRCNRCYRSPEEARG